MRTIRLVTAVLAALALTVVGASPARAIVGGQDAYLGQWPAMASVQEKTVLLGSWHHACGGVLVSADKVLTAAQCVAHGIGNLLENFRVTLGGTDLAEEESGEVVVAVRAITVHPQYNPATLDHDLAVLTLAEPVTSTETIAPATLGTDRSLFADGQTMWTVGWGLTVYQGEATPNTQQWVDLPKVNDQTCRFNYIHVRAITPAMVCAGYSEGGKAFCTGDTGGPLMALHAGNYQLVGIASWSTGCAWKNYPSVYTRISATADWIKSQT